MRALLPVILLIGLIAGCSKPKASHPEGPLDIDWARRDQERRFKAHEDSARAIMRAQEDSVRALFRSTLVADREMTAEASVCDAGVGRPT